MGHIVLEHDVSVKMTDVRIPVTISAMESLLENLNAAQAAAVTHETGPLLIVAGAGTGKTTVLTRRYAHLLTHGKTPDGKSLKPEHVLAVTFTEKAAGELEDRVLQLLPTGTYDFWIHTFHGFCQRVLEAHALEIGLPNEFKLVTPTDAWLLLRRHTHELPLNHYRPLGNPNKFLRGLLSHISKAKDEGVTPEQYLAFVQNAVLDGDAEAAAGEKARLQEIADLYFFYRKLLLEESALDFGDLILETLRLFRERPAILAQYRKQFRYVLVDEFQDTNWAQYELIKLLAGTERNLTVVGDDDQAIYKFRGASLANILQFRDDFPDARTVALTQNYRSFREILDVAYGFIKKNDPNRLEVRLADTGLSKQLEAMRGEGARIQVKWQKTVDDEADAVAEEIKRKKQEEPETRWDAFAVLVRSNDSAEPFVRAFERHGIPFQFMALRGLYAKPIVLDLIAMLSLADGYHESSAVWRVLAMPCYAMGAKDMAELVHHANRKGIPLWSAVKNASYRLPETQVSEAGMKIAAKIVQDADGLGEAARREPPMRVLQLALDKSLYLKTVLSWGESEKREAIQHLNGLADRIKRYERSTHGPTLRGFLEEFRLEVDSGEEGALDADPEAGPELVKILTVHAAKGLEWKHVYLVSLVEQRFPSRARPDAIPLPAGLIQERLPEGDLHLEEERRLFYVALTRARDTLTLTGAVNYGGTRDKKPSPFLAEAGFEVQVEAVRGEDARGLELAPQVEEADPLRPHFELKRRFSFTQLAAFRKCPLQYKFAHLYRIPILGSYQKSFGQSVHLAFQRILEMHKLRTSAVQASLFGGGAVEGGYRSPGGFTVSEEEAVELFEDAWIDEWYPDRRTHDEYWAKGKAALKTFWRACAERAPDVVEIEKDFTLLLGQHSIKGKIDRVDRVPDGSVEVLDYKTGTAKEELGTEDKEQLWLYQIALEERGVTVSRLAYWYVIDGEFREVEPLKEKKRAEFLEKLTERMDGILRSEFQPTPEPFTCKFCDFKNICEFRK